MARARARTENIETDQLDFFIEEFYSRDQTALTSLGAHDKVMRWRVRVVGVEGQRLAAPVDPMDPRGAPPPEDQGPRMAVCQTKTIEVHVKKGTVSGKLQGAEVSVSADGQLIFPSPDMKKATARMKEDFSYTWKFRGSTQGLNQPGLFQMDVARLFDAGTSQWIDCVILEQRPDGLFEVSARTNPSRPNDQIMYPGIRADLVRFKDGRPMIVPEHTLEIEVPKDQPLKTTLLVNGRAMTHFLGRGSPKGSNGSFGGPTEPLNIFVEKDRRACTVNAGHSLLSHFMSGEVMAGMVKPEKLKKAWVLQVGPFAEHTVSIERKYQAVGHSHIITLQVDGTTLIESNADDLDCDDGKWQASWQFFGERFLEFDLNETDRNGTPLESRSKVRQPFRFSSKIDVRITNEKDFSSAELYVDDTEFRDLRQKLRPHDEPPTMTIAAEVLLAQYRVQVPYKMKWEPPRMIDHLQAGAMQAGVAAAPVAAQVAEAAGQAAGFLQTKMSELLTGQQAARRSIALEDAGPVPGPWSAGRPELAPYDGFDPGSPGAYTRNDPRVINGKETE